MRPRSWTESIPGIAEDFYGVWLFHVQDFVPNHLADYAGAAEKVRVTVGDGLASDGLSVTAGAQVLPRAGVVGESAEGNAGPIGALSVTFLAGFRFGFSPDYASQHEQFIENIEIARPEGIGSGAARIHSAGIVGDKMLFAGEQQTVIRFAQRV